MLQLWHRVSISLASIPRTLTNGQNLYVKKWSNFNVNKNFVD